MRHPPQAAQAARPPAGEVLGVAALVEACVSGELAEHLREM